MNIKLLALLKRKRAVRARNKGLFQVEVRFGWAAQAQNDFGHMLAGSERGGRDDLAGGAEIDGFGSVMF